MVWVGSLPASAAVRCSWAMYPVRGTGPHVRGYNTMSAVSPPSGVPTTPSSPVVSQGSVAASDPMTNPDTPAAERVSYWGRALAALISGEPGVDVITALVARDGRIRRERGDGVLRGPRRVFAVNILSRLAAAVIQGELTARLDDTPGADIGARPIVLGLIRRAVYLLANSALAEAHADAEMVSRLEEAFSAARGGCAVEWVVGHLLTAPDTGPPTRARKSPSPTKIENVIAVIRNAKTPLTANQIRTNFATKRKPSLAVLRHDLAWMVANGHLIKPEGGGYWPATGPSPA